MDALFLIFNLAYIIKNLTLISVALTKKKYIIYKLETYKNIPVEPHPIRIEDYKKNKNQYISSINKELKYNYYKYDYLEEDIEVLEIVNNFRNKNKLKDLRRKDNIPEFIINEISEVILFNWQNLFKLSNDKYLFKCEVGKFNYYFKNNNQDFNNILLKKEINSINIITQRNIQYILLYKDDIDNEL